jgi:hypothetical protein
MSLSPVEITTGQASDAVVQEVDLHAHVIRHARAVGFVLAVQLIAEGSALGVKDNGKRTVRILPAQALEHVEHALDRTGWQALGGRERRQRVESAVQVRRTVHQDEGRETHVQDQPFRRGRR